MTRKFKVMAIIESWGGCRWSRGYFNSREEALDALFKEWEDKGVHPYSVDLIGFWLIEDSVLDKGKKVYGIPKMDESYLIESIAYSLTT